MIDWDGDGVYSFELLDSLEELGERLHRDSRLKFTYESRTGTVVDGETVRYRPSEPHPVVAFREYDPDMHLIFGVTGRLLGSIIDHEPLASADGLVIPDTDLAVVRARGTTVFGIPTPSEQVYYHPRHRT